MLTQLNTNYERHTPKNITKTENKRVENMYHATFVPQKTIRRMKNWKLEDICDTNTLQMIHIHNKEPSKSIRKDKPKEWWTRLASVSEKIMEKPHLRFWKYKLKPHQKNTNPAGQNSRWHNYLVNDVAFFKETACVRQLAFAA